MSKLIPYFALAIFPLASFLGYSLNPIEFTWTFQLGRKGLPFEPLPPEVREKSEAVSRYLSFLVDALIVGLIVALSRRISLRASTVGLHLTDWKSNAAIGIISGILLVLAQRFLLISFPVNPQHPFTSRIRRGAIPLWAFILVTGAFSEELWIAFCLVALRVTGYSSALSVLMIAVVFAAAHYSYRFWGALAVALKGSISALLFLHYGSLFVTFFFHFVGNLGSLYWNRYWRR